MNSHPYLQELVEFSESIEDRRAFHKACRPVFEKMRGDAEFFDHIVEQNLQDENFLNQAWSLYNIPYLYVGESSDFVLKYHIFVPLESKAAEIGAACIHHHTNYYLSSAAVYGPGYESFLFNKNPKVNEKTMEVDLKITKYFNQQELPISVVDSWEPHVLFNPTSLSATLALFSPDKKRSTDKLRHNPILKRMKKPLLSVIHSLNLQQSLGVSEQKTFQYYPGENAFMAIDEDEYFEPTRNAVGPEVDDYSVKTIMGFIQKMGYKNVDFLKKRIADPQLPATYRKYIQEILEGKEIGETFAKSSINIPKGKFTKADVLRLASE